MSLVSTLLLNQPVTLPAGRTRFHYMDIGRCVPKALKAEQRKTMPSAEIHRRNLERLLKAIRGGASTTTQMIEATGFGMDTVQSLIRKLRKETPVRISVQTQKIGPSQRLVVTAIRGQRA